MPLPTRELIAGVAAGDTFAVRDLVARLVLLEEGSDHAILTRRIELLEKRNTQLEKQLEVALRSAARSGASGPSAPYPSFEAVMGVDLETPAMKARVHIDPEHAAKSIDMAAGRTPAHAKAKGHVAEVKASSILRGSTARVGYAGRRRGTATQMRSGGYTCTEVRGAADGVHISMSIEEVIAAGFSLFEACASGYTCKEAHAAGYSLGQIRAAGFVKGLKEAYFTCAEAKAAGYHLSEMREGGFSCREARDAGALSTCAEAKAAGYSPVDCYQAGFTFDERVAAGQESDPDGGWHAHSRERSKSPIRSKSPSRSPTLSVRSLPTRMVRAKEESAPARARSVWSASREGGRRLSF